MDAQLVVAIIACLGAFTTLAGAVTIWIKQKTENEKRKAQIDEITADREKVARERGKAEQELRDAVQKHSWELDRMKREQDLFAARLDEQSKVQNSLNLELAKISTKMDQVISTLQELKEDKKAC